MTMPIQPVATEPHAPVGNESSSTAKFAMIAGIGTALVTTIGSIVIAIGQHPNDGGAPKETPAQTSTVITPPPPDDSALGWLDKVTIEDAGSQVAVTGGAARNVESVVVMIGPRQSGGQYWAAGADVFDRRWSLVVATDPSLPTPYEIKAYFKKRPGADVRPASWNIPRATTPVPAPTPVPGQEAACAVESGDSCFKGPGWGAPTIYRSDQ